MTIIAIRLPLRHRTCYYAAADEDSPPAAHNRPFVHIPVGHTHPFAVQIQQGAVAVRSHRSRRTPWVVVALFVVRSPRRILRCHISPVHCRIPAVVVDRRSKLVVVDRRLRLAVVRRSKLAVGLDHSQAVSAVECTATVGCCRRKPDVRRNFFKNT